MNKLKIILTIGASCSGKSSWAEDFVDNNNNWVNINRDDIRFALFTNGVRDWSKYKFKSANETRVTEVADQFAFDAVIDSKNIIISDTNLNPKTRNKWQRFAEVNGYEYHERYFPCKWDDLVKRNSQRYGGISESILWDQYMRYERQFGNVRMYEDDPELLSCIICDIDGTVAEMVNRKPFEWDKVSQDKARYDILGMVGGYAENESYKVIFLSGRDSICRKDTEEWIEKHIVGEFEYELYMRPENDNRKDDIVKDELYENHIRGRYNVVAVVDDRPQMIRHWTLKGMPNIINVGEYNKEF